MANSSRDPYWQGSVAAGRSIDHPESKQAIEDECSVWPTCRRCGLADRDAGRHTDVFFAVFRFATFPKGDKAAADGVTCSVCHQIEKEGLGTEATFCGECKDRAAGPERHAAGVWAIRCRSRTPDGDALFDGYVPADAWESQVRDSGLCGRLPYA